MARLVRIVLPALLVAVGAVPALAQGAPDLQQRLTHYCRYWGSAGLFPDDEARIADNPLAKMAIPLATGGVLEFPLLYIYKGYELDESPREWVQIWDGFRQACPGWPKPEWLVRLEQWQQANRPKEDPRIARDRARMDQLVADAQDREARASDLRTKIVTSKKYQDITGGRDNWLTEAQQQADYLARVVSLEATRYTVIGRLEAQSEGGYYILGLAIAPRGMTAPGTYTVPTRLFISKPRPDWLRENGDFLALDATLVGLVDAENPTVVFGTELPDGTRAQVAKARAALKRVEGVVRNGQKRIEGMMKPVERLEQEAAKLREEAAVIERRLAGP